MPKLAVLVALLLAGAIAGFAFANFSGTLEPAPSAGSPAPVAFDSSAPVAERLQALEEALSIERQARQLLQEEVFVLTETLDGLQADTGGALPVPAAAEPEADDVRSGDRRSRAERRAARRNERLLAAGFTQSEVEWIERRESELRMEALESRYEARRAGENPSPAGRGALGDALREELGDASYERYLEASGRPTRVAITSVFEGSPALTAGLKPGDEIVRYDGQRVFGMDEITRLTLVGSVGEPVPVDIVRDGALMQVSMPRGPLGVVGGRRYRR